MLSIEGWIMYTWMNVVSGGLDLDNCEDVGDVAGGLLTPPDESQEKILVAFSRKL